MPSLKRRKKEIASHSDLIDGLNDMIQKLLAANMLSNYVFYVEDVDFYFYEIAPEEVSKISLVHNPVGLIIRSKTSLEGIEKFNSRVKSLPPEGKSNVVLS